MRVPLLLPWCAIAGCDPVNTITVRFPVDPLVTIDAYWVTKSDGRAYASTRMFGGDVSTPEFRFSNRECCGTAAAYRDNNLWFIACVSKVGRDPVLVCGRPDDPETTYIRHPQPNTTCEEILQTVGYQNLDLVTCTPQPLTPASMPQIR